MIEKLKMEIRTLVDAAQNEKRELTSDEQKKFSDLKEMLDFEKAKPVEVRAAEVSPALVEIRKIEIKENNKMEYSEIKNAMIEKRAITVNGTGAVNVIPKIVREITQKMTLASKYKYFYGANANTVIPVFSPGLAVPAAQAEGATSVASDGTGVLGAKSILPKAYVSVLPVSAETLLMSGAALDAELPSLFAEAFGKALFNGSMTGAGTGNLMQGMFLPAALTTSVSCGATGTPKLFDLVNLALKVQDYADDAVIVINPSLIAAMIAETTAESAPIKAELMATRTCMGVPVVMSSVAPSTLTAASVVAVAMPMSNYGVAVANEMVIDPIKVKGDTNTYFQATMFFNGVVIAPSNGFKLVTV